MILDSPIISGSAVITGNLTVEGSLNATATSASYAQNAELLDGLDSSVFVSTSSFNTYSGSVAASIVELENTASNYVITSESLSGRVSTIESKYATTGSNSFTGTQTITGSLVVTSQIVAQTLNVQQVSSSIVYSSGSNVFGNNIGNTHQFTGSVLVTGSVVASSIARTGGTSAQFLKADGSVDGTSYATAASLSGYLPLSGGTLTGQTKVLYAMGEDNGLIVGHSNLTQNIQIGYNTIKANGTNADQNLTLYSKGTGVINLVSNTQINGTLSLLSALNGTSLSMSGGANLATSSGNVGIGTTFSGINTASLLTIKASSDSGNQIYLVQSNDDRGWRLNAKIDGHFYLQSAYSSANIDRLVVRFDTGNVGIGTDAPLFRLDARDSLIVSNTPPANSYETTTGAFYIRGETRFDMGGDPSYFPSVWRQQLSNVGPFNGISDLNWDMSANGGAYTNYMQLRTDQLTAPAFSPTSTSIIADGIYKPSGLGLASGGSLRQDFDSNGHARFKTNNFYQNGEKKRTIFGNATIPGTPTPSTVTINVTFASAGYASVMFRVGGKAFGGNFNALSIFGIDTTTTPQINNIVSGTYITLSATRVSNTSWNFIITNNNSSTAANVVYELEINSSVTITN